MGVDRRDYMHEGRAPGARAVWATLGTTHKLILVNVLVWILWQIQPRSPLMLENFLVSWSGLFEHGRIWTTITAAFSHQALGHLFWNMLYLLWFGPELEQVYGRRNFSLLYFHAAVTSSLAHVAWAHGWGRDVPCLGASGAIMAVVTVTAIFYPHRTIWLWFFPVPLWLLAAFKLLGDFAGMFDHGSGTSHAAHLGGALAGVFFWFFDLRLFASPGQEWTERPFPGVRAKLSAWRARVWPRRRRGQLVKFPRVDGDTAVEVDELLRKIARGGMESLTPDELEFLKKASDRYRGDD